jgi:hypothetical protein
LVFFTGLVRFIANHFQSPFSSNIDSDEEQLEDWRQARRKYLKRKELWDNKAIMLFDIAKGNQTIVIRYNAGNSPGIKRKIIPKQLFKVEDTDQFTY